MSAQVLFNPLNYVDRLTRGGFTPEQARASAEALESAFAESVATKTDIADVKHEIADVKHEIADVKHEITDTETRLKLGIAEVKNALDLKIAAVEGKITLLQWMIGFTLAFQFAIFGKLFVK